MTTDETRPARHKFKPATELGWPYSCGVKLPAAAGMPLTRVHCLLPASDPIHNMGDETGDTPASSQERAGG